MPALQPEASEVLEGIETDLQQIQSLVASIAEKLTDRDTVMEMTKHQEMVSTLYARLTRLAMVTPELQSKADAILGMARSLDRVADPASITMWE